MAMPLSKTNYPVFWSYYQRQWHLSRGTSWLCETGTSTGAFNYTVESIQKDGPIWESAIHQDPSRWRIPILCWDCILIYGQTHGS